MPTILGQLDHQRKNMLSSQTTSQSQQDLSLDTKPKEKSVTKTNDKYISTHESENRIQPDQTRTFPTKSI